MIGHPALASCPVPSYFRAMNDTAESSADLTLDEVRAALAPHLAMNAMFDGWTMAAVDATAAAEGVEPAVARLAFKGGAPVMIDAWIASVDAAMRDAFAGGRLDGEKIREKFRLLVEWRLDHVLPVREAVRRASAILAMPRNLPLATRTAWRSADAMWRLAGDTATDYNYYTKRGLLAGIYGATLAVWLEDDSDDQADSRAFLARRIDGVMRFEKAKAGLLARTDNMPSLSRFVGRLRYPAR